MGALELPLEPFRARLTSWAAVGASSVALGMILVFLGKTVSLISVREGNELWRVQNCGRTPIPGLVDFHSPKLDSLSASFTKKLKTIQVTAKATNSKV